MTHSPALVHVGLRIGRWLLPWVAVVVVSATLVYALNGQQPVVPPPAISGRMSRLLCRQAKLPDPQSLSAARQSVVASWTRRSSRKAARSTAAGRPDVPAHRAYCPLLNRANPAASSHPNQIVFARVDRGDAPLVLTPSLPPRLGR
jgi:hypothetical protein